MQTPSSPAERIAFWKDVRRHLIQQHVDIDRLWRLADEMSLGAVLGGNGTVSYRGDIGFDRSKWGIEAAYTARVIENIADDVAKITRCRLVFAGVNSGSGAERSINFSESDWAEVKAWIEAGGRLWLQAEYGAALDDPEQLDDFLNAMGVGMSWNSGVYDSGCDVSRSARHDTANISDGAVLRMAATAEILGGTPVWRCPTAEKIMVAVEAVGDGFLFVSGDGNLFNDSCGYIGDNSPFALRLYEYEDSEVI